MIREKNALRVSGLLRPFHPNQGPAKPFYHIIAAFLLSKNRSGLAQTKLQPFQQTIQSPPSA